MGTTANSRTLSTRVTTAVTALLIVTMISLLTVSSAFAAGTPAISADQADYGPLDTALLSGVGFDGNSALTVTTTRPDGSIITGDGTGTAGSDSVNADASGAFTLAYELSGTDASGTAYVGQEGTYQVDVLDASGTILASTTFLDSHFRYGHVTWVRAPGSRTVTFTVTTAWRTDWVDGTRLYFGDGSSVYINNLPNVVATLTDAAGDQYKVAISTVTHTYATDGPFTSFFSSCCRIFGLVNASSASFRVESTVDLRSGNLGSPVSSIPPLLQMVQGVNVVPLPIADPDGDSITCRMATSTESGIPAVASAGGLFISVSTDCVLTWNASAAALTSRYAVQVILTDTHGDATDDIALDFMIEIVGGVANQFPTCVLGGAAASVLPINAPFSIGMVGDDPDGGTLTANALGMPVGATFGPASGAAPLATSFSWTPTAGDAGSAYAISVVYADAGNLQALCSFSIEVEAVPAGPTCDGLLATIIGTPGDDDIYGTPGDDVIVGLAGADNIHGLGGNDTICGNEDRDQIDGGDGNDRIFGNEGPDRLHGKAGEDYIDGGDGDDVVYGGNDNDEIHGGAGNDRLKGENGDDKIFGDAGNDTVDGRNGFDMLYGGADDDRLYGGDDNDWMEGGDGYNVYYAGNGDDVIIGGADRDRMKGEAGSDTCNGNGGLLDSAETCEVVSNVP